MTMTAVARLMEAHGRRGFAFEVFSSGGQFSFMQSFAAWNFLTLVRQACGRHIVHQQCVDVRPNVSGTSCYVVRPTLDLCCFVCSFFGDGLVLFLRSLCVLALCHGG